MRQIQIASSIILALALIVMGIHQFIAPLSAWMARTDGVLMLAGVFALTYSTIQRKKDNH